MKKWRIVILGFGTARQKMVLERWTNPKKPRHDCRSCRYLTLCLGVLDLSDVQ
jgi:radical SAM protein with 4Fe4S-binding SPASM domain